MDTTSTPTNNHKQQPAAATTATATAEPITDIEFGSNNIDGILAPEIPTVELQEEQVTGIVVPVTQQPSDDDREGSLVVAELTSARDVELEIGSSHHHNVATLRAEWISARIVRGVFRDTRPFGIQIGSDLKIKAIDSNGIINDTPICVGDTLYSINNKQCSSMGASASVKMLLRDCGDDITIIVHNEEGSPDHVESMISKATRGETCGLGLKRDDVLSRVIVSSIKNTGKFSNSLLNVGDQILKINNIQCENVGASIAADIINEAAKYVTILAESSPNTGIVLAETLPPQDCWWKAVLCKVTCAAISIMLGVPLFLFAAFVIWFFIVGPPENT